ncbi:MAG: hypothetical protein MUE73_10365 [Planctomycetes bacterium]|nr:hypothetical protein [Planctomycetota bacterium]
MIVVGGVGVGMVALYRDLDPFDDRPFDPAAWAAAVPHDRGPMARDAIRHLLPGTAGVRVRELLGEPQPVERDPRRPTDVYGNRLEHPETWSYYLGNWSGFGPYGFDDAFLYVHFGPHGRVIAAEVTGG